MKFESIKKEKFNSLTKEQLKATHGGAKGHISYKIEIVENKDGTISLVKVPD